mmetsp:Transcript_2642/g.7292  ORF Transcript_2642/g.7292 Transcript_2642/m.7292 type:complete len:398 (-) Transcript_2642:338-1531(-)|eukprot:CAMPEP_0168735344 /NCGR_PEP_ID=MMETSP0724-20121128/9284_1 /TAXON_ID=265536 /ORGANISM="Amphiprora sp., Strain CCMP467" /LENGTH=397 /DNA_ID=CAMNT_0008782483 /DNA_START=79 /DNA_END=1272 /DNA_ORIENTATION=-
MSWFSSLAESAAKATESAVKAANIDPEVFQKLTLNSPELAAERQKIDEEERRKEVVRDKLAGLLPWETRDPDRDILVPECKEVIMNLSKDEQTFLGPWEMPEKNVDLEEKPSSDSADPDANDEAAVGDGPVEIRKQTPKPSAESLEKLSKLEPLPTLLGEFDLDSHVGLIERVLKEDQDLVHMQSSLSGGGSRETIFWKNYFFHCAYCRYEAGLSVDEVWSEEAVIRNDQERKQREEEERANKKNALSKIKAGAATLVAGVAKVVKSDGAATAAEGAAVNAKGAAEEAADNTEHTIAFDEEGEEKESSLGAPAETSTAAPTETSPTMVEDNVDAVPDEDAAEDETQQDQDSGDTPSSYEMVTETTGDIPDDDDFGDMEHDDPELDELEAEIAEALED